MRLYSATLRIIGTSEAEAKANAQDLTTQVANAIGFYSTDGTIQITIENVTDNNEVRELISYLPWSKEVDS